jgi:uncharacterized membrane protein YtjA (UPF0391 family)
MLRWALVFLVVALIAGLFGFLGVPGMGAVEGLAATIGKVLFFLFLVLFVFSLIAGYRRPIA